MKKNKEITIDDLALMIAKGFNEVNEKMDKKFNEVNEKMDAGFKEVRSNIKEIERTTEEIKTNLNKKVDKIDQNTLTYRVEKLEKKYA